MYQSNPVCIQPSDGSAKIWRYLDFTKYISLLQSRRLYFARSDKFEDPFEGSWPQSDVRKRHAESLASDTPGFRPEMMSYFIESLRQYVAINCWHMNEHESAAMWNLYLKSNEGIAVQSTYDRLRNSIIDPQPVHLGVVGYIDYGVDQIGTNNVASAFMHKRMSFAHECEVRAMIVRDPITKDQPRAQPFPQGIEIKVDLEHLIERVYIAPTAPGWFTD
jgi:hypothetical protein